MTSSTRYNGKPNRGWQCYKNHDPFEEPGLVSILFLSCGRHKLTKTCLDRLTASVSMYDGEIEWVFFENGQSQENIKLFRSLPFDRKKIVDTSRNWGINVAFNDMHRLARGEFCVEMENDWFNVSPNLNWLRLSKDILAIDDQIGLVQLRSARDPCENWGLGKPEYSPWTCGLGEVRITPTGHRFLVYSDFYGYNHNPHIMRKRCRVEVGDLPEPVANSDLRHGETSYQKEFRKAGYNIAHIGTRLFEHVGGALIRKYELGLNGE